MGEPNVYEPEEIKALRVAIDAVIQLAEKEEKAVKPMSEYNFDLYSTAHYQVRINLIQAKMWAGKMLEGLGMPFPKELADRADAPAS